MNADFRRVVFIVMLGSLCLAGAAIATGPSFQEPNLDIQNLQRQTREPSSFSVKAEPLANVVPFFNAVPSVSGPPQGGLIPKSAVTIRLEDVATGLIAPVSVTHANDGSGRLFIVEQSGQIRILEEDGDLLPTPFLDLSDQLPGLNQFFDERGLLGLAFHPYFASNGRFFVRFSRPRVGDPAEPCSDPNGFIVGCHEEVVAEFKVSDNDPNVADPNGTILFRIDEPQFNHNAGDIAFGPDGFLYFSLGDGGGANDGLSDIPPSHGPTGHGQNIETHLGTMLRIDVDSPPQVPLAYAIPPNNPFVGRPGLDEIYAYGFRNPFKFSFDDGLGGDGALYLADVGQNLFEEVSIVVNGGNYGWVTKEGTRCFDPFNPGMPPANCSGVGPLGEPLIDPIAEYSHPGSGFAPEGGITVIGGFVYRGSQSPGLFGTYVFGDFAQEFTLPSGSLYFLTEPTQDNFEIRQFRITEADVPYGLFLKGFGEDEDGEIYVCGSTALAPFGDTGVVQRLVVETPPRKFKADLTGDQEVMPVQTDTTGEFEIEFNEDFTKADFRLRVEDGKAVTAAHIHCGAAGQNGPIVAFLFGTIPGGFDVDGDLARFTLTNANIAAVGSDCTSTTGTTIDNLAALAQAMKDGNIYINVHTVANPPGEVRGQVVADDGGDGDDDDDDDDGDDDDDDGGDDDDDD